MTKVTNEEIFLTIKARTQCEVFSGKDGFAYITYNEGKNLVTRRIRSREYRRYLLIIMRKSQIKASGNKLDEIIEDLEARAFESEVVKDVFIRVGFDDQSRIIIDNSDSGKTYTVIEKGQWSVINKSPVPFIGTSKQRALPATMKIGRAEFLKMLSKYFHFKNPDNLLLVLAFILKCFIRQSGSCVIFVFQGRQDSGKSSASELIKTLVDPTDPLLSIPPKTPMDVIIMANSSYFLGYDNLSGISNDLADFFCSVVYGISYSKRSLYTNDDEIVYNLKRDILFNGIEELSKRADFLDRVVQVELASIKPEYRKSKTLLQQEMAHDTPYLLHGIYDLLSEVLEVLPTVQLTYLPRMADFARIGIAIEKVLELKDGTFLSVYHNNILERTQNTFWEDELCCLIFEALNSHRRHDTSGLYTTDGALRGTAMELNKFLFQRLSKGKYSPRTAQGFGAYLKRVEPLLKLKGIKVDYDRSAERREIIISFTNPDSDFNPESAESSL